MAKRVVKTNLLDKALQNHAADETDYGREIIDLPPGISNGVAQLIEAKIGEYKKGDYQGKQFLYLAGTVIEPIEHTHIPKVFQDGKVTLLPAVTLTIEGQRTSLMVPLCDTTDAQGEVVELDDNIGRAMNELRKLGVDTESVDSEQGFAELLEIAKSGGIHFKFSTSSRDPTAAYPQPRTWENWYGSGGLEDYIPDEDSSEVVDKTQDGEQLESPEPAGEAETTPEGIHSESLQEGDGAAADEGDTKAGNRLTALADGLGIDVNAYPTWQEVEDLIAEQSPTTGEKKEFVPPETGEIFGYKPPRARKEKQCKVMAVFTAAETCNLKSLENGDVFRGVAWDKLVEVG